MSLIYCSPLEQFEITSIIFFKNFSITINITVLLLIFFIVYFFRESMVKKSNLNHLIIPTRLQIVIESFVNFTLLLVLENIISKQSQRFFPFIFSVFTYILSINTIGLVPYGFTLTSHLIVTFVFSLTILLGVSIICIKMHGVYFFSSFLPTGVPVLLSFLLVPIELISYISKSVSLSIRLFANMMGGHTLLKVISGFSWSLTTATGLTFAAHYIPFLLLIVLLGFETGVALIQSLVFSTLICIYLNDAINLH
jgi:ATP synthase subunit 6